MWHMKIIHVIEKVKFQQTEYQELKILFKIQFNAIKYFYA
jgi:hypothetical protein